MKIIKTLISQCFAFAVLAGLNVYAADQSICHSGTKVSLHNDGSLQACQLNKDYDINSIQCKANGPISFYTNGSLESCLLAKSTSIGMIKCQQNGLITFFMDGNLKSCMKPDN
jgi:hypothetical protein